ncbi:MAG: hypothetical protein KDD73_05255 [Anaerolineales bacterium]|nr:hypothetical protein [Anaerolineales bacterium]MCB9126715.1 hypothetical protein [Ardenticatenales bacterium]MCB9171743.1 hypothetical protein [Ardenticatenales bacterium]
MGYSNWSNAAFNSRQNNRKSTGQSAFAYDAHVRQTGAVAVHPQMDPKGVRRESRDSDQHPQSLSIGVIFDVTGSMGNVPRTLQSKLGSLMRMLIQNGYVAHPQILFGAVGDAYSDRVPLQIGQFESGLEMDDDLGRIYIEGGGGGQMRESYDLALYFMAHHTEMDCWEKRGKKAYLFTIGDEMHYDRVRADHVRDIMGDEIGEDIPFAAVIDALHRKYEHFHILPTNTYHGGNPDVQAQWRDSLGERVLLLEDENAVCETIALAIALCEGTLDTLDHGTSTLVNAGYDAAHASSASTALTPFAQAQPPVVVTEGTLPPIDLSGPDGRL